MRMIVMTALVAGLATGVAAQGKGDPRGQTSEGLSWGALTAEAIANGFPQGAHSSDPSGDGHGPGTADEPRAGLANVVERGNLGATTALIDSLLN